MKIVHKNKVLPASKADLTAWAISLENEDELAEAATVYEKLVKAEPLNENAWNRLMIIYRKLKENKKELNAINEGIKAFKDKYKKQKTPGKKITQLSAALMKATGLADKKGNSTYEPEPIGRWEKRKHLILRRLKK